jgi:hypothetical protein
MKHRATVKPAYFIGPGCERAYAAWRRFPNLLYRRFPNRQGVETAGAFAGLETRDTADLEVCATVGL